MPNHIQNIIEIVDEKDSKDPVIETEKLAKAIKGKYEDGTDHPFDFNKIIPMPEELKGTKSPADVVPDDKLEETIAKVKKEEEEYKKKNPNREADFFHIPLSQSQSDEYIEKYGANNWYDWSVNHWDTKWNSYENTYFLTDDKKTARYEFHTAWAHPEAVIKKLSEMFPTAIFYVQYADEDRGSNLGIYKMKNGEILEEADMRQIALSVLADKIWDEGVDLQETLYDWFEDEEE